MVFDQAKGTVGDGPGSFAQIDFNGGLEMMCALDANRAPDGTLTGIARFEVRRLSAGPFPRAGAWSCVGRYHVHSGVDHSPFTSPWGSVLTFDVHDIFHLKLSKAQLPTLTLTPLGRKRYALHGVVGDLTAAGGKISLKLVPGYTCPRAPALSRSVGIAANGNFGTTITLPQLGGRLMYIYGWKLTMHYLGSRFIPAITIPVAIQTQVSAGVNNPPFRRPTVAVRVYEDTSPSVNLRAVDQCISGA